MQVPKDDRLHQQGSFKDQHVPLRDPEEGKSPAIGGGHLTRQGDEPELKGPPDPPVKTIADLQREHSAHIEEIGMQAYHDEGQAFIDQQIEAQDRGPIVEGVGYKKHPDDEPPRRVEHRNHAR